jgi:hypothetical protein
MGVIQLIGVWGSWPCVELCRLWFRTYPSRRVRRWKVIDLPSLSERRWPYWDRLLERSASRKVGSLNRLIILRADSSLELMQDTQTEHDSGEEADRSSSVSMEDLAWSRRVRGSLRSCGLRRDRRFETAQLGRE